MRIGTIKRWPLSVQGPSVRHINNYSKCKLTQWVVILITLEMKTVFNIARTIYRYIYIYIYENYVVNIKGLTYILSDALYVLGFACDPVPRPPKFHWVKSFIIYSLSANYSVPAWTFMYLWLFNRVWSAALRCVKVVAEQMYGPQTCTVEDQYHVGAVAFLEVMMDSSQMNVSHSPAVYDTCSKLLVCVCNFAQCSAI